MKISPILLISLLSLVACKKEAKIQPVIKPVKAPVVSTITVSNDTIPDKAYMRIQLVKDSDNYDETMFVFKKSANLDYDQNEDADYIAGFGLESIASISGDGKDLAINSLPYSPNMAIGLDVNTKADGVFTLKISYESKIPAGIQVWVKDAYLKDSVDISTANYNFNVIKANATSFGNKRFKLVIKDSGQQQTAFAH